MRRRTAIAVAAILTIGAPLALSACSSESVNANPAVASAEQLGGLPASFTGERASIQAVTAVSATETGLAVATIADGQARLTVASPSGVTLWSAPLPGEADAIYGTREAEASWVSVRVGPRLLVFNASSVGSLVKPLHSLDVGTERLVATSSRLLLVDSQALVNSREGTLTRVKLTRDERAIAGTSTAVLLASGETLVGLRSDRGGWLAAEHVPEGAQADSRAKVLAQGSGVVVAQWGDRVAAHRLLDGVILATASVPGGVEGGTIIAADASSVAVGGQVLDLASGTSAPLPEGFAAASAFEGLIYGESANGPSVVDAATGQPMAGVAPSLIPEEFTPWRSGLLFKESSENGTVGVDIAPLRPLDTPR